MAGEAKTPLALPSYVQEQRGRAVPPLQSRGCRTRELCSILVLCPAPLPLPGARCPAFEAGRGAPTVGGPLGLDALRRVLWGRP